MRLSNGGSAQFHQNFRSWLKESVFTSASKRFLANLYFVGDQRKLRST